MTQIAGPFRLAATGTSVSLETARITGNIVAVGIAVHGFDGDFTIKTKGVDNVVPQQTILIKTGINADGWYYTRPAVHDTAGAEIADTYDANGVPVDDQISIEIANTANEDIFDVSFMVD